MCGIFGFVSNEIYNPGEFWQFAGRLAYHTERRGRQATGFAATLDGKFITDKKDVGAAEFVRLSRSWRGLRYGSKVALIGHTRAATSGRPEKNENNHPFTGSRYSIAHNGGIGAHERVAAALGYNLRSECDSELLLHLLEDEKDIDTGVARVFTEVDRLSWMAVCVLEREKGVVHLFRDNQSPCVIMSIPRWNATVFCSTKEIVADALTDVMGNRTRALETAIMIFKDDIRPYTRFTITEDGELQDRDVKPLIKPTPSFNMSRVSSYSGYGEFSDSASEWNVFAHDSDAYSGNPTRYLPAPASSASTGTTPTSGHSSKSFEDTAVYHHCSGCNDVIDALDLDSGLCPKCNKASEGEDEGANKRLKEIIAEERKASSGLLDEEAVSDDDEDDVEIRWKQPSDSDEDDDAPLTYSEEKKVLSTYSMAVKLRDPNPTFTEKDKNDFLLHSEMSWETKKEFWRDMTIRKTVEMSNGEWKAFLNFIREVEDEDVKRLISPAGKVSKLPEKAEKFLKSKTHPSVKLHPSVEGQFDVEMGRGYDGGEF